MGKVTICSTCKDSNLIWIGIGKYIGNMHITSFMPRENQETDFCISNSEHRDRFHWNVVKPLLHNMSRVLSREIGFGVGGEGGGWNRMYTPTSSGHTHFTKSMSITINIIIATTFKQVLPVCICNSTGSSEISRVEARTGILPLSLQRVGFIPNFTPACAITN